MLKLRSVSDWVKNVSKVDKMLSLKRKSTINDEEIENPYSLCENCGKSILECDLIKKEGLNFHNWCI